MSELDWSDEKNEMRDLERIQMRAAREGIPDLYTKFPFHDGPPTVLSCFAWRESGRRCTALHAASPKAIVKPRRDSMALPGVDVERWGSLSHAVAAWVDLRARVSSVPP